MNDEEGFERHYNDLLKYNAVDGTTRLMNLSNEKQLRILRNAIIQGTKLTSLLKKLVILAAASSHFGARAKLFIKRNIKL